jgi:hypothetical protein
MAGVRSGEIENLFLVLRLPTEGPFPGAHGFSPMVLFDGWVTPNDAPVYGMSYTSRDGGKSFERLDRAPFNAPINLMFSLRLGRDR